MDRNEEGLAGSCGDSNSPGAASLFCSGQTIGSLARARPGGSVSQGGGSQALCPPIPADPLEGDLMQPQGRCWAVGLLPAVRGAWPLPLGPREEAA